MRILVVLCDNNLLLCPSFALLLLCVTFGRGGDWEGRGPTDLAHVEEILEDGAVDHLDPVVDAVGQEVRPGQRRAWVDGAMSRDGAMPRGSEWDGDKIQETNKTLGVQSIRGSLAGGGAQDRGGR